MGLLRGEASCYDEGHWEGGFRRVCFISSLFLSRGFLLSLLWGHHGVSSSVPRHVPYLATSPEAVEPANHGLNPLTP